MSRIKLMGHTTVLLYTLFAQGVSAYTCDPNDPEIQRIMEQRNRPAMTACIIRDRRASAQAFYDEVRAEVDARYPYEAPLNCHLVGDQRFLRKGNIAVLLPGEAVRFEENDDGVRISGATLANFWGDNSFTATLPYVTLSELLNTLQGCQ